MKDLNGNYEKFANSVYFTLISRGAMIMATLALPIAGWMIQRGVNSVDMLTAKMDMIHDQTLDTNASIKLIQQNQESQGRLLADHEMRVRMLENINRAHGP